MRKLSFITALCLIFSCAIYATFVLADENKGPALVKAAQNRDSKLTQTLLKQGADVNAVNSEGMTPLKMAAKGSTEAPELIKLLKGHGAKE